MEGQELRGCNPLDAEERIGFPLTAMWLSAYCRHDDSALVRVSIIARCIAEASPLLLIVLAAGMSRVYG